MTVFYNSVRKEMDGLGATAGPTCMTRTHERNTMGTAVNAGRWTIAPGAEVTAFLIGMRVNHPLRVHRWGPAFTAMPRMMAHLAKHPEAGMLATTTGSAGRP